MMSEKAAAVNEYKRKEQACFDKWESNPELVPEECMCTEDLDLDRLDPASPLAQRFGDAQASLGLDRYSVGFDLPFPTSLDDGGGSHAAPVFSAQTAPQQDVGGPVLETLAGMSNLPASASIEDVLIGDDGEREDGGREQGGSGGGDASAEEGVSEKNETWTGPMA